MLSLYPMFNPRNRTALLSLLLPLLAAGTAAAAPAPRRKPVRPAARKPAASKPAVPVKPAPKPAVKPAVKPAAPVEPPPLSPATLGAALQAIGFEAAVDGRYRRIHIDEERFAYSVDFSLSESGDWLVCMAHLAPIEDLTKVPAQPLLSLLATNDRLLGMYFSYNRPTGQVMLNATVPNRGLTEVSLRNLVAGLRRTVKETHGLWDPARW